MTDVKSISKPAQEVIPQETRSEVSSFIHEAIKQGLPVETMERLFALQREAKADKAREAFTQALANFQAQCPVIEKTKKVLNKDGRSVRYMYAPIESIVETIKQHLANNGLSYNWNTKNAEERMEVTCKVTHVLGHSETSTFEIPIDKEGFMTAPQKYASAQTFAKRYTLCNVLGISTGDEDTDATDVGKEAEAKSLKAKIIFSLRALGAETDTKEQVEKAVLEVTQLKLEEKNYGEIVSRLSIKVKELNDDKETA